MKMTRDTLALLDLPKAQARLLPGHGWRPPEEWEIKINTDGSVALEARRGGVGGVARSHSTFRAAWCKPYQGITDPLISETLAIRDGVIFAKLRGYEKVVMESDCLEVVNLWNSRHDDRTVVAPILSEILEHSISFKSFCIQYISRTANYPTHLCARHASTLDVTECWFDSAPGIIVTSFLADSAGASIVE